MFQDVSVTGYRVELTCVFYGAPNRTECSMLDCFRAVAWLLEDISTCYKALASPTSALQCRMLPVHPLYATISSVFTKSDTDFFKSCKGSNKATPARATVAHLGRLLNYIGINYGPG
jgi:hypothetical protein